VMLCVNLTLNLVLIWPLREAGLAASTAITATLQVVVLMFVLQRRHGIVVTDRETRRAALAIAATTAVMAAAVTTPLLLVPTPGTWWGNLGLLAGMVGVGLASYLGAAAAARSPELRWLRRRQIGN